MAGRVAGKVAIVVGAWQTPGQGVGNGRAAAPPLAGRGGRGWLRLTATSPPPRETVDQIVADGGDALVVRVHVTSESDIRTMTSTCLDRFGRIDVLHNNVGVSVLAGDAPVTDVEAEAFGRVMAINLEGMVLACKHALPVMREEELAASSPTSRRTRPSSTTPMSPTRRPRPGHRTDAAPGDPQRRVRHPRQHHPSGTHGDPDGHRIPGLPRTTRAATRRSPHDALARRCVAWLATPGMSPPQHCSSPPMRELLSPAPVWSWTGGSTWSSVDWLNGVLRCQ